MNRAIPVLSHRHLGHSGHVLLFLILVALLNGGLLAQRSGAAVSASLSLWHGYDFYYAQLGLNASNPAPVTFHWMENASGNLWKQFGDTNGASGNLSTNDLNALRHECTNGLWKLYLNRGDVSEGLYYFTVSLPGVDSNLLGNVQISFPLDTSTGVTNNPTYQWTGPSHFPTLTASARKHPDGNGSNYFATLPSTATSWTPGPLTPGANNLLLIYATNNSPYITFTTPTNTSGIPLADWSARGNLNTYAYSFFHTVASVGDAPLAQATDAPQFAWSTGGAAPWFLQTAETSDGVDAAQSGAINQGEESWIETTIQGPGYIYFSWNISSHEDDYLRFTVNDVDEAEIYGDWGWDSTSVYLEPGTNVVRWTFDKNSGESSGEDAAWLDEVEFEQEFNISMFLKIGRHNEPGNSGFFTYPTFGFSEPNPITQYEIIGPGGFTSGALNPNLQSSVTYDIIPTLGELITEIESGPWTLHLNPGTAQAREFTFTVTVNQLDVTNLPVVNLTSPLEWETGIATNHNFVWTGPTNYQFLNLHSYAWPSFGSSGGLTNPPVSATSAQMPNPLVVGTNRVAITYHLFSFDGVNIGEPTDSSFNSLSSWSAETGLLSSHNRTFVVGDSELPPATPVQILNPQLVGGDFSFALLTQSGRSHTVQSRTNLTTALWLNETNFSGDGEIWQFTFPVGPDPEKFFRVSTQ